MSRGRDRKLTAQTGEYLVAAELARRGLIATTFTGNVPYFDIVASDHMGRHVSVQVKATKYGVWQFNIEKFCDIKFSRKSKQQRIGDPKPCPIKRLVFVFVRLDEDGNESFYILTWHELRDVAVEYYGAYLAKHGGVRPRKWRSLHCAIREKHLLPFRDKWDTVEEHLK